MILAIDPGTTQSGVVLYANGRVVEAGTHDNAAVLRIVRESEADVLAVERFEARGMAMGDESVVTVIWTGRFQQAWRSPESVVLVKRSAIKSHLCGTQRAKDTNVRAALLDLFGGKERAIGKKAAPGPLYGVTSHAWAALAVAITASHQQHAKVA